MDDIKSGMNYTAKFWDEVNKLEYLSIDQVNQTIEENLKAVVPLPENLVLRQLKALNKNEEKNAKKHLLPTRHPDVTYFIADGVELPIFRDDMASMENPLFALKILLCILAMLRENMQNKKRAVGSGKPVTMSKVE